MSLTTTEEALVRELLAQQAAILSLAENEATIQSKLGATKVTLSDLTPASSLADTDLLLVRQGTSDKSTTGALLKTFSETQSVKLTGDQTVAGVKTFSSSPLVPNATTSQQAAAFGQIAAAFTGSNVSLSGNGYQKLPSGLIIQWGSITIATGGSVLIPVSLPITFPHTQFQTFGTSQSAGGSFGSASNKDTGSIYVWGNNAGMGISYISIGY